MKSEGVTIRLSGFATKPIFKEFDIMVTHNNPLFKPIKTWHMVYRVESTDDGETLSLRKLNVSSIPLFRNIELWILRKLLKEIKP